jgi:predicted dehydrogenase
MSGDKTPRLAIIGCGAVENATSRPWAGSDGYRSVDRPSPARLEVIARRMGVRERSRSSDLEPVSGEFDTVVAFPYFLDCTIRILLIKSGKHMFIENPFAISSD